MNWIKKIKQTIQKIEEHRAELSALIIEVRYIIQTLQKIKRGD